MTLLTRITRLFKADMHGLLDTIEEPQAVLKQAIREMEEQLRRSDAGLVRLEQRQKEAEQIRKRESEALVEAEQRIALCLDAGNDALAKSFVRKKLESGVRFREIVAVLAALADEQSKLQARIAQRKEQLRSIQERAAVLHRCEQHSQGCGGLFSDASERGVSEEDIEVAFLEEKQRRTIPTASVA